MDLFKKIKKIDKYTKLAMILIILFSIIIFTLTSIYHISGDACWHLSVARFIAEEQKIPLNEGLGRGTNEPFWAPPLFHIVSAFVYSIFNNLDIMKFISPIFAILTLIFTFLLTKKIFNAKIAFYTLIFLAFIPIFIDYSIFSYVESMLLFFIVLSIYFAINNKVILASITAGLGILTKYNALFIIPLLVYIIYKNNKRKKNLIKNISIIILLPLIVALPWFIRNYVILGNPIWPFLNFIFNGLSTSRFGNLDLSRLIDLDLIIHTYLGLFGVPNGDPKNLFFFNIPLLIIIIWLIGTLIFILPLIYSKKLKCQKSKISEHAQKPQGFLTNKNLITIWISSYLILLLLYIINVGFGVTRIILPAMPAIAIIWAHGFNRLLKSKYKKIIPIFFILIIFGFIFAEFIKITLAANEWNSYKEDFDWVKNNTQKNDIILANWQCSSYNLNRFIVTPINESFINKADYIWVNQEMNIDFTIKPYMLGIIKSKNFPIIYENKKTGTVIYKVKKTTNS